MKKIFINVFSLLLIGLAFTSCNNNDDVAAIDSTTVKPTLTIDFPAAITVTEGTDIPVNFTISQPVGHDFEIRVLINNQLSTASSDDSDITNASINTSFEKVFTFPAFATTYSDVISIVADDLIEPTETLSVFFDPTRTSAVAMTQLNSTITIQNVVQDKLDLTFHFDRSFSSPTSGATFTLCGLSNSALTGTNYDVDFILYDAAFTPLPNFQAQTGACTEALSMDLADYPDGLYHITAYLYANADLDVANLPFPLVDIPTFDIPITVDYLRSGSISGTYTQEAANYFTSDSPVNSENQVVDILISTVGANRVFTIQDTQGNITASGRMAHKSAFKSKRVKL